MLRRSWMDQGLAFAAALAVATPANVGARTCPQLAEDTEDPTFIAARTLYDEGRGKFETADYEAAIELWTEAYTILPATPEYARIKVLLLYDLATARERAYEVDRDAAHLRQAKILLESFEQSIPAIYGSVPEADRERGRVRERIGMLDAKLAQASDHSRRTPGPNAEDRSSSGRRAKPLIGAGAVLLALGGAGAAVMTAGLAVGSRANDITDLEPDDLQSRRDRFEQGRAGNAMAIAGGVLAAAFVVTGAVLVGMGVRAKRRVAAAPRLDRGIAGVTLSF